MAEKKEILSKIQPKIKKAEFRELESYIQKIDIPEDLIVALLFCCGYDYVDRKIENHIVKFWAGVLKDEYKIQLKVQYNKKDKTISGDLTDTLKKAYSVIYGIENFLNSAIMLPPELKFKKIEILCRKLNIDEDFYSKILRNWSFA